MFANSKKYVRGIKVSHTCNFILFHKTLNVIMVISKPTTCFNDLQLPSYNKINFDHFPIIHERLFE